MFLSRQTHRELAELRDLISAREISQRIKRGHLEDALVELKARKKQERTDNDPLWHLLVALEEYVDA